MPHAQSVSGRYSAPPEWVVYQEAYDGEVCMCARVCLWMCMFRILYAEHWTAPAFAVANPNHYPTFFAPRPPSQVTTIREISRIHPRWLTELVPHYYSLER